MCCRRSTLDRWIADGYQRYAAQRYATSGTGGAHEQISVSGNRTSVVGSLSKWEGLGSNPKTGKRKDQKKVIAATSMADASSQRELLRTLLLTGGTTGEHRLRLGEYASSWMRGRFPPKPSTRDKYVVVLDHHILPALGDYYVDAITPQDVLRWRDAQHAKPSTVNSRLRVLRTLLRDAQAQLGLRRDPCARVRTLPEEPTVGNRLKPGQLRVVLAHLQEHEPELVSAVPHDGAHRRTLRRSLGPSVV